MVEMSTVRRGVKAPPNIYTVLTVIAFLVLASAVGYLLYRNNKLFGSQNPLAVPRGTGAGWVLPLP